MIRLMRAIFITLDNTLKTLNLIYTLLETHLQQAEENRVISEVADSTYDDSELITVKEASGILRVSRWKVEDMRKNGELTTIKRKRQVRLIQVEVQAARKWYSVPKGKV